MDNLFSTHPNVDNRIAQLDEIARQMGSAPRPDDLIAPVPASGPWASASPSRRRGGPWG
jgi:heat shock protein HtpX